MRFYVIYSVDVPRNEGGLAAWRPPGWTRLREKQTRVTTPWTKTEGGDARGEYAYLGDEWGFGSVHAKWVGDVSRKEFDALVHQIDATMEDVHTGGSLTSFGWLPAMSFTALDASAIVSMYVTPLPERGAPPTSEDDADRQWNRLRRAMLDVYGR